MKTFSLILLIRKTNPTTRKFFFIFLHSSIHAANRLYLPCNITIYLHLLFLLIAAAVLLRVYLYYEFTLQSYLIPMHTRMGMYIFFSEFIISFLLLTWPKNCFFFSLPLPALSTNDYNTYSFIQPKYEGYKNTSMIKLLRYYYLLCVLNIGKIQV